MARKRFILLRRIQSFLKSWKASRLGKKCRALPRFVLLIFLTSIGLITALNLPVISAEKLAQTPPGQLSQQAQQFYARGQYDRAEELWEQAAFAYEENSDIPGRTESLINLAAARKFLGNYPQACNALLQAFDVNVFDCQTLIEKTQALQKQLEELENTTSNNLDNLTLLNKLEALAPEQIAALDPETQEFQGQLKTLIATVQNIPDTLNKATGLRRLGDLLRLLGNFELSKEVLNRSLLVAQDLRSPEEINATLIGLGNTERALGNASPELQDIEQAAKTLNVLTAAGLLDESDLKAALDHLQQALDLYQQANNESASLTTQVQAQINYLNLLIERNKLYKAALDDLQQTLEDLYQQANNESAPLTTEVQAEINDLNLLIERNQLYQDDLSQEIASLETQIQSKLRNLPPSRQVIYAKINLVQSLTEVRPPTARDAQLLATAVTQAKQLNNPLTEAYAIGSLGHLYEERGQLEDAQRLTETALSITPTYPRPEIAYRWQWQLGRILEKEGKNLEAKSAYNQAFNTLETLRTDLSKVNSNVQFAFRDTVEPVYRGYVSLLLPEDANLEDIRTARDVIESLKRAEIDNFFNDPCLEVSEEFVEIGQLDPKGAVIYPIVLEDRLEIILELPGQALRHYPVIVKPDELENTIQTLRVRVGNDPQFPARLRQARGSTEQQRLITNLQTNVKESILPLAQKVYQWLIAPIEPDLNQSGVENLIFVLDGALRNIPMAVLHNGNQYLIQQDYNIAVTSGLKLLRSPTLKRGRLKVLAAGISKTSQVAPELPPLEQVKVELEEKIKPLVGAEVLLDEAFTKQAFQTQLESADFNIIHLATHGQFSSNPEDTFILTWNELVDINELNSFLGLEEQGQSLDLLVLSACETAEGDNRAILGLAGIAVRGGTRSTLATLWNVSDEASPPLMGVFYQNLAGETPVSKAKALREGQLALLADPQYQHPHYWAPFVLVGDWL